jgi:hypothetical protein
MALSEEEERVYQKTLQLARRQLDEIDAKIEEELAAVRERLEALRTRRKAAWQMYDAACSLLGVDNEMERMEAAPNETPAAAEPAAAPEPADQETTEEKADAKPV